MITETDIQEAIFAAFRRTEETNPALHMMRGHFKTYTPEAPLFGKRVGTWWWQPGLRGNVEKGIVLKDYAVEPEYEG